MKYTKLLLLLLPFLVATGCKKDKDDDPGNEATLHFKFVLDPNQQRLDNFGQPAAMPAGNAGQVPQFNGISAHYVELTTGPYVQLGDGEVLFMNEETDQAGSRAIVFDDEVIVGNNEVFLSVPLRDVTPGDYQYIRVSLAYQNYDVEFDYTIPQLGTQTYTGTLASFVGYNTYISSYQVKDSTITVNDNKLQGYWGFETQYNVLTGQAPVTTVPNPLAATSPIPAGSCVVTGEFNNGFTITGDETEDVTVVVSLSINNSFEWEDLDGDGNWDPGEGENVVDMGLRGLLPYVQ